jgi:hypothetical protein
MQKARGHPEGLPPLVSTRFQISFIPLIAVLFIVQSPYWFAIGHQVVFSLGGWTPHVQPGFPEPEFTRGLPNHSYRAFTFSGPPFQAVHLFDWFIRVRSPLLTESLLLSFPLDTEMFHFSRFALYPYAFRVKYPCGWVAPFGYSRITALLPAPLDFSQVHASFIAS